MLNFIFKKWIDNWLLQFYFSKMPHTLFKIAVASRTQIVVKNRGTKSRIIY